MPRETRLAVRNELRKVAIPVRDDAQALFVANISADRRRGRYGISVRKRGSVSVEQRVKSKGGNRNLKRPKFAAKQIDEFLIPAANRNETEVIEAMNNVLAHLQRKWARG